MSADITHQRKDLTVTTTHISTSPDRFASIPFANDYPTRVLQWNADDVDGPLALHVVDAPASGDERGVFLLLHGEPTWGHLYSGWIGRLTAAGYRCVVPDLPGFGRSDKPVDDDWYSYERHCAAVRHVINTLDLRSINLVVQDWAGPIGLRQPVDQPSRFDRLFIFNTWLHHEGYVYSEGARRWQAAAADPSRLGGDMPTGRIVGMTLRRTHDLDVVKEAYDAPFGDITTKAGPRAFPAMLPFAKPDVGGAAEQQRCYDALLTWDCCPVHIAFGDADPVFPFEQAEAWANAIPSATLDRITDAGHFVQLDASDDCLAVLAHRLGHPI
jgi:haloalkane dehalogenase